MTEAAREAFLAQFSTSNQETLVGLAVMGGIFGEGIDLGGERLIGVVVVGVGVPQLGLERELIKEYFDARPAAVLPTLINIQVSTACSRQPAGSYGRRSIEGSLS